MRGREVKSAIKILIGLVAAVIVLTACDSVYEPGQKEEINRQQSNYDRLVKQEPAKKMKYSPSRETINFWIETWGNEPGKLAYVYLVNQSGDLIGYYVLEGPPISTCALLTPNYRITNSDPNDSGTRLVVPAPGMDGVWYPNAGSCQTMYGKEALTGAYREFSTGSAAISHMVTDQPLPQQDVKPLGETSIEDVK